MFLALEVLVIEPLVVKMAFFYCRIGRILSSRVVSAVKGIIPNIISKSSSSSSACSNTSIVQSKLCNGCCGDSGRARSPDPIGTGGSQPSGGNNLT